MLGLISSGAAKTAEEKKTSSAKKTLSAYNGKKSPANAKRGSPGANANRRGSPAATAANKRGSPGASKQNAKQKEVKQKVEKKAVKTSKPAAEMEKHNSQVQQDNQQFTNKLVKQSHNANDFESSVESVDGSWSSDSFQDLDENEEPVKKGELVILNVDLGARGH